MGAEPDEERLALQKKHVAFENDTRVGRARAEPQVLQTTWLRSVKAGAIAWGMRRLLTFVDDWGGLLGAVLPLLAIALVLLSVGFVWLLV
jgi:hypothetical protein